MLTRRYRDNHWQEALLRNNEIAQGADEMDIVNSDLEETMVEGVSRNSSNVEK